MVRDFDKQKEWKCVKRTYSLDIDSAKRTTSSAKSNINRVEDNKVTRSDFHLRPNVYNYI